jgi:hypothetical protein
MLLSALQGAINSLQMSQEPFQSNIQHNHKDRRNRYRDTPQPQVRLARFSIRRMARMMPVLALLACPMFYAFSQYSELHDFQVFQVPWGNHGGTGHL